MPDDVIKKKEEKDEDEDEKMKLAKEKKAFQNEKLAFKRNQYVALGGSEALAKKIDSISNLDALIEHQQGIAKKNKAPEPPEAKKIKVTAGKPNVTFPDGSNSIMKPVMNSGPNNIYHFIDPTKVPRRNVLFNSRARINFLPPDNEHPYNRVIA